MNLYGNLFNDRQIMACSTKYVLIHREILMSVMFNMLRMYAFLLGVWALIRRCMKYSKKIILAKNA